MRDPRVYIGVVFCLVVGAGFAVFAVAWRGAAALLAVPFQVPFMVSGGFVGLGLVGIGLGLFRIHLDRCEAATERRALADLHEHALAILEQRRGGPRDASRASPR